MRTLLLADDSVTVQRVIALTFANEPFQVVSVGDGQQAIEKMAAKPPDIVLAGTTVPTVNGYDLAKYMRSKSELRNVPVLLLAGAFENVDDARLRESGANGIIEKPVEPTTVIGRVKELLGLKSDEKPAAPAGRTITSPGGAAANHGEKTLPVATPPRAVTNTKGGPTRWDQLRTQSGLEANAKSVEDSSTRSADYLDTLDAAFDTLDEQLSGRAATTKPRNPSGPLAQSSGAADPRSPGRPPSGVPDAGGNPIFEIDDDWFGEESAARADARAGRREIAEDLKDPDLQGPSAAVAPNPIFEVDDEWFKEGEQARAAKLEEQRELAAEMGIHDVDLPEKEAATSAGSASDFEFGLNDFPAPPEAAAPPAPEPAAPVAPPMPASAIIPQPVSARPESSELQRDLAEGGPEALPVALAAPAAPVAPVAPAAPAFTRPESSELWRDLAAAGSGHEGGPAIADDFAALLAYEQGDPNALPVRPPAPPPEIRVVAPEITEEMLDHIAARVAPPQITDTMLDHIASRVAPPQITDAMLDRIAAKVAPPVITGEMLGRIAAGVAPPEINDQMLDQIASSVADRLSSSTFGEQLREQIAAALRDTVRSVVSETSERLVRDEIERIKGRHGR